MFLSLLTSFLLSACVGLGAIQEKSVEMPKIEHVQKAYSPFNNLNGGYAIRIDTVFFDEPLFDYDVTLDFSEITNYNLHVGNPDFYSDFYGTYENVDSVRIKYDHQDNEINLYVHYYDYTLNLFIGQGETSADFTSVNGIEYSLVSMYFNRTVTISTEQMNLFNRVFSRISSSFTSYNGWFSFKPNPNTWGFNNYQGTNQLFLYGSFSYVNYVGDSFSAVKGSSMNTCDVDLWNESIYSNDDLMYPIVTENVWQYDNIHIYMNNVYISYVAYEKMLSFGTFEFVPVVNDYSLTDLFYDIADTPVYFITSLFDFNFLGVSFIAGFMGLLTVLAMVFILKKVI